MSKRIHFLFTILACASAISTAQGKDAASLALPEAGAQAPVPQFANIDQRLAYLRWLEQTSERLKKRLPNARNRIAILKAIWYEAKRAGLDPALVMGLIQVESGFHKDVVSKVGARGFMQVMPFWTRAVGDGDHRRLFDAWSNLRYGCTILRQYLDQERGNLFLALGRYNGSRGKAKYPRAVLAASAQWRIDVE
jgi:soluble lytic murein transglycosylase-like protein